MKPCKASEDEYACYNVLILGGAISTLHVLLWCFVQDSQSRPGFNDVCDGIFTAAGVQQ